jgi:hypothetical protein
VRRGTARQLLVLSLAVLVAGCTGGDPGQLAVTSPSARAVATDDTDLPSEPRPERSVVRPDLTRDVAWRMSAAGEEVLHSAFGGLTISLGEMSATDVDRYCPDGARSSAAVCAEADGDTQAVMVVDLAVRNESRLRLLVRPEASSVMVDGRRLPAAVFAGSRAAVPVADDVVEGQLQWVLPVSVDDLRDAGGVELHIAVPPIRGATESRNEMVLFVII